MKDKKKLIYKRIQEIYKEYSEKKEKGDIRFLVSRYSDLDMDEWVLKED